MNRACFAVDTDGIGYEIASTVLVMGCVGNRTCFAVDTDGIGCETAFKVPVLRYVVTGGCIGGDTDQCKARGLKGLII